MRTAGEVVADLGRLVVGQGSAIRWKSEMGRAADAMRVLENASER